MQTITSNEIRQKFLDFMKEKGHAIIPSAPLVPENDPTALFNVAGMQPLVPYLMGETHPLGTRLADSQKCIRTNDIEEVGDNSHLTFFEMLGNWSLGDYFKEESIAWSYEFLTSEKWLALDPNMLAVTVFEGDEDAPRDEESAKIWKQVGIPTERISYMPKEDNWWAAGDTGPCGSDTEIFYWVGEGEPNPESNVANDEDNWMEIWNNVFMEYNNSERVFLIDGIGGIFSEETFDGKYQINKELATYLQNSGRKTIILTNKSEENFDFQGYNFAFYSTDQKFQKTQKEYFEGLFEQFGLKAETIIYIEHSQEAVDFANSLNIKSIHNSFKNVNEIIEILEKNKFALQDLPNKNVDTGMGLERITTVLNGEVSVYHTDIFRDILNKIVEVLGITKDPSRRNSIRIIADHARSATFLISDGVFPSNTDQGYILRRLIRRAIREAYKLGFQGNFLGEIATVVIGNLGHQYKNLETEKTKILEALEKEENQFGQTLEKGLREFDKLIKGFEIAFERSGKKIDTIAGTKAFKLYDTYGFPFEMTLELATEKGLKVDKEGFDKAFAEHQEKSRSASAGKFKGGLADDSVETTQLHSATHLLLAGLRTVVGDHVHQKGSNITAERLRFDFNNDGKVEREVLDKVEEYVNNAIAKGFHTEITEMDKQEAMDTGVEGSFWEKYPERVTVYTMKGEDGTIYSRELCGGPHVVDSKDMGTFKIKKEQASSAGVRRIKAVLIK